MISIINKRDCCGCEACAQKCPKGCIEMIRDSEGFLYPQVDVSTCIDCGLCNRTCPFINHGTECKPIELYAMRSKSDTIRLNSSSGGIFSLLAIETLKKGGVVFGAKFDDNLNVLHGKAEIVEQLDELMRSKYVQSRIGESFKEAKTNLDLGREVLFVGTSCQIKGLHNYLHRQYTNLLTVDVVCHGVPSPAIWLKYLEGIQMTHGNLVNEMSQSLAKCNFRDKRKGWKKFGLSISCAPRGQVHDKNEFYRDLGSDLYMQCFLSNLSLRPSCYACAVKSGKSGADITIGDFWGINKIDPAFDDDKGTSLVFEMSPKGRAALSEIAQFVEAKSADYDTAISFNPAYKSPVCEPRKRKTYWKLITKGRPLEIAFKKATKPRPLFIRGILKVKRMVVSHFIPIK